MLEPDTALFERLAQEAVAALPPQFRAHLDGVQVRIEEFADAETLESVGLGNAWDLSGLYQGRPWGEQSIWDSGELPPVITLYRRPLLREMRQTGVTLEALVTHVVVHEVGHHFGLSDEEMAAIEDAA
jgi:predicted Zn-dependent protease with MMP-like domain